MTRTYDPDFTITVAGTDVTPLTKRWILEDIEDGISSLTVVLGNPELKYAGKFLPENDISIRFGYHKGEMSPTITMKIKDVAEHYPTTRPPTIELVGLDCTERLVGVTHAGNSEGDDYVEMLKSLITGIKAKPEIGDIKQPEKRPETTGLHNMTSHAAIRWIMGKTVCAKRAQGGQAPIKGQEEYDAGPYFKSVESITGDRMGTGLNAALHDVDQLRITNIRNRAGATTITGRLRLVGQARLQAKKCLTITNVGEAASGKWYIRKLTQEWGVNHGYTTHCALLRPTLGMDGRGMAQPVVLYADIYKQDTVYVGCRKIDAESQATYVYGQPEQDASGGTVIDFSWATKLSKGRGAGEMVKARGFALNNAGKITEIETEDDGDYKPQPPPQVNEEWGW